MPSFVHLHLHSEYSLTDSTIRVPELVAAVAAARMPAVALTDDSNLFALVKFHKAAEAAGLKPISGADVWVEDEKADPFRYAGATMCVVFLVGLVVLPFLPETKGKPLPED